MLSDNVRQKFTSEERDIETGLDYFLARYYSSTHGRFASPDEFSGGPDELFDFVDDAAENPTFYAELDNPQSLNKYQYTYNNPVNMTDDDGHCPPCFGPSISVDTDLFTNPSRLLDKVQTVISVVGVVPGGDAADLVNAGISALRGNTSEAVLDTAGALGPVVSAAAVGNRFRKLVKFAKAAGKADDAVEAATDISSGATKARKQVFREFSTRKQAIDARPKPLPAQKGKPRVTRQSKNKAGIGTKSERHEQGGRHFHDDRHNKKKKPNKHYGFPD
ncbi:MAG TPA: RHS repeat-associated core domain-containing protein [Pyrinomonadaceae bacterium]|nr:RHS repeat-associated core domain-containing protein [Pyrinomonadaceae bacterium]